MDKENQQKNKNPSFSKDLLVFSIIFTIIFIGFKLFSASLNNKQAERVFEKEESLRVTSISNEYRILSTQFKEPQKVAQILSNGLVLENGTTIRFQLTGANNVSSTNEKYDNFYRYANTTLLGNMVSVVLPPEDFFLREFGPYELSDIYADVYFEGEYLNENFNFAKVEDLLLRYMF